MAKFDFQLVIALIAPLLVWPWVPGFVNSPLQDSQIGAIALFLLAPIAEEILFRGLLQGWLLQKNGFKNLSFKVSGANWCSSLAFAAAHAWQHTLILVPGYFVISLVLGHFRERYHGILVPILLHAYYNLGLLIVTA